MKKFRLPATCVLAVGLVSSKASVRGEQPYGLVRTPAQTVQGTYSFDVRTPKLAAKEWIVFAAQVPELPGQTNVRSTLLPGGVPYRELSDRSRDLLRARIPATAEARKHHLSGSVEWRATLYARHVERRTPGRTYGAPSVAPQRELQRATAETKLLDFSQDAFQAWLDEHRLRIRKREDALDFGRRAYLAITRSKSYDYAQEMNRQASHVCDVEATDCGGMCVLFAAAMRANDVPARILFGRWARSAVPNDTLREVPYLQQHVKAEFYVDGLGWIPVDLSSGVLHDKSAEGLRYFARDPGDFLTVHVDPDLTIDTIHFGKKDVPFLQSFHYYVTGTGKFEDVTVTTDWKVEKVP